MSHTIKDEKDLVLLGEPVFIDTATSANSVSDPDCKCLSRFTNFFSDASSNRMELNIYDESGNIKIISTTGKYELKEPQQGLLNDTYRLKIDIDEDLRDNEITQGAFHVEYHYFRPITNFVITQVSPSRKEIRVKPTGRGYLGQKASIQWVNEGYKGLIGYSPVESDGTRTEFVANFGDAHYETVVNWTTNAQASGLPTPDCEDLDNFAINFNDPDDLWSSMVLKLYEPLPDNIIPKTTFTLDLCIVDPFIRDVILYPSKKPPAGRVLRDPDWDIRVKKKIQQSTGYENYDSLVGSVDSVKSRLINKFLSGSQDVDLNYDFRYFENFIHFSTAEERLNNFFYKAKKIEQYDENIAALSTGLPTVSASLSASDAYQNNIIKFTTQKDALIGTFDQYENYLYYESASAGSSSFDITGWYPTTWPKQDSTKPYTLYSYSSSAVTDWYGTVGSKTGIIYSASLYDRMNPDELAKTTPNHIREDTHNDFYDLFVKMCGQHFDELYFYTKHLSTLADRNESIHKGLPKDLIFNVLQGFGWDPSNGMQFDQLWESALGTDASGSYQATSSFSVSESMQYVVSESTPRQEITQEIWKRILNNLPYLLKAKGSWEAVRALINCYGIPSTMLDIKEYGGPDVVHLPSYFQHDKFNYAAKFNAYSGSYIEIGNSSDMILSTTSRTQDALEFRFKTVDASEIGASLTTSESMQILVASGSSDKNAIRIRQSGSTNQWGVIEQVMESGSTGLWVTQSVGPAPIFDGNWWTVLYQRLSGSNSDDIDQTYELYLKQQDFGKITQNYSGSWIVSGSAGSISSSYQTNNILRNTRTTYFGNGDILHGFPLSGHMQEIRLWGTALSESKFNFHVLSPMTYVGNNPTASYNDLYARYTLGTDLKERDLTDYRLVSSSQPNQFITTFSAGGSLVATASQFLSGSNNSFTPNEERVYQVWPDSGGNRTVSNKIRIESTELSGMLDLKKRLEISAYDNFPNDSSKVGVYFSPTTEINEDIAEQMGGFNIDNYIGDPRDQFSQSYETLRVLRDDYFQKYQSQGLNTGFDAIVNDNKYSYVDYFRLIKFFDTSLFKQIEYLLPARVNPLLGVVIEPHVLERSKAALLKGNPTWEDEQLPEVELGASESLSASYHLLTASIEDFEDISGSYSYLTSSIEIPIKPSGSYFYLTSSINEIATLTASVPSNYTETGSRLWTIGSLFGEITTEDFTQGSLDYYLQFKEVKYQASQSITMACTYSYAGLAIDKATAGTYAWINPSLCTSDDYGVYTSATGSQAGANTHYLQTYNYGFNIPSNATNISVKVRTHKSQSGTGTPGEGGTLDIKDYIIQLVNDGSLIGSNKADVYTAWPSKSMVSHYVDYNANTVPGYWAASLTPDIVNNTGFGVVIQANFPGSEGVADITASVAAIKLDVCYTSSVYLQACNEPELYPRIQRPWIVDGETCSTMSSEVSHPNLYGVAHLGHSPMPWYYLPDYTYAGLETVISSSRLSTEWYKQVGFMTQSIGPNFTLAECDLSASRGFWQSSSYELAEYQDYLPLGIEQALYTGIKCTSPDFNRAAQNATEGTVNINGLQDTPDGKAVVEIFYTDPNRLFFAPEAQYGNLAVNSTGFSFLGGKTPPGGAFQPTQVKFIPQWGNLGTPGTTGPSDQQS